jgi:hypothetical protein
MQKKTISFASPYLITGLISNQANSSDLGVAFYAVNAMVVIKTP